MRKKLVDMDCTLIDGAMRVNMEQKVALEFGISPEVYWEGRMRADRYDRLGLTPYQKHYWGCREVFPGINSAIVQEWMRVAQTPMLFPETMEFLDSFPKEELILFTAGEPSFQNVKIDANGLRDKFSEILILPSPKALHFNNPEPGMIYLDDSPREIDAMRLRHPSVYCIQVREPGPWETQRTTRRKHRYAWDLLEARQAIQELERS